MVDILRNSGLKSTAQREELIEILKTNNKPICYNDIKDSINMDKATFYRTMNLFEDVDIVTAIDSSDKRRYYELKTSLHNHFSCSECHSIICLSANSNIELDGYEIESVTLHGKCPKCNNK